MPGFLKNYGTYLCFILFVALTAGYHVGYYGLVGYRTDVGVRLQERADMIVIPDGSKYCVSVAKIVICAKKITP